MWFGYVPIRGAEQGYEIKMYVFGPLVMWRTEQKKESRRNLLYNDAF